MKTDRSIIADLPDKTEVTAHCHLSRRQAALYAQAVEDLARSLEDADGIRRKGLVLAMLMRLKQICNHPSQWLNDGGWAEADSGKLARLREIAEVVAARQEKMLVFTQFREVTVPLATFLGGIFGRAGLVLHGGTAVKQRQALVRQFQDSEAFPFFVLSLKAGGCRADADRGIACRAFRPMVESGGREPSDRPGLPDRPDGRTCWCTNSSAAARSRNGSSELLESKQDLSDALLTGGDEVNLTAMTDEALLQLVALDLDAAIRD